MPEKEQVAALVSVNTSLQRITRQIATTNKLLAKMDRVLIPYRRKDKWGFCTPDKKIVIDCVYDSTDYFSEGLAKVRLNNKCGFIDKSGNKVIPIIYQWAWGFSGGLTKAMEKGKYGFINKLGKQVIPFIYDEVTSFGEYFVTSVVLNGEHFLVDKTGRTFITEDVHYSIEDKRIKQNGKWGLINMKTGKIVISCIYDEIGWDSAGLRAMKQKGKWGFVNSNTELTIPHIFDDVKIFSEDLAGVRKDNAWGFINTLGELTVPYSFEEVGKFKRGLVNVKRNGKWALMNNRGELTTNFLYDSIRVDSISKGGLIGVKIKDRFGVIDRFGRTIIPCIYNDISVIDDNIAIEQNNKWGFMDRAGKIIVHCIYEDYEHFKDGMFAVCEDENWGIIDKTYRVIIPSKYYRIDEFEGNFIAYDKVYQLPQKIIDKSGNIIKVLSDEDVTELRVYMKIKKFRKFSPWHCIKQIALLYSEFRDFSGGLAAVKRDDKWGFIDSDGNVLIPCIFNWVVDFKGEYAHLCMQIGNSDGISFINNKGVQYWED